MPKRCRDRWDGEGPSSQQHPRQRARRQCRPHSTPYGYRSRKRAAQAAQAAQAARVAQAAAVAAVAVAAAMTTTGELRGPPLTYLLPYLLTWVFEVVNT